MKGTIKLITPIQINGKTVKELTYDTNEITAAAFAAADSSKQRQTGKGNLAGAVELDYALHVYLGFAAIIAVNAEIDMSDLERIKGEDIMQIMRVGRAFITERSVEHSDPELSESVSESTPEPFTPPLPNSGGED